MNANMTESGNELFHLVINFVQCRGMCSKSVKRLINSTALQVEVEKRDICIGLAALRSGFYGPS